MRPRLLKLTVSLVAAIALFVAPARLAHGQVLRGGGGNSFVISGRIIVPLAHFQDLFEVLLIENLEQVVQATVADSQGRYRFINIGRGTYYITVKLEGFEDVRQRVDVGNMAETIVNVILDFKEERVVQPAADYSGEESGVIDAAELGKKYPAKVVDELRGVENDIRAKDFLKAQNRLEMLVQDVPDLYDGHNLLGIVYQKQRRFRDAETEFRTSADLKPNSAAPLINLGSLYIEEAEATAGRGSSAARKVLNEALGSLTAALKLNPNAPFAYYLLGVTYYRSAFYEDAEDNLKRAVELDPRLLDSRLALTNVYIKMQEWTNAIAQLDAYLASNPKTGSRAEVEAMRQKLVTRSQQQVVRPR